MSETTNNLDAHWRSACKIIFGEDVGPMTDYANWLLELTDPVVHKKSAISGKEVTLAYDRCVPGSKFISNDEVDYGKRFPAAALQKINSINDLLPLISDRLSYTGNVILGKSEWVERSSNITDCFFMYSAGKLVECKYVAYSTWGRECEDDFGSNGIAVL